MSKIVRYSIKNEKRCCCPKNLRWGCASDVYDIGRVHDGSSVLWAFEGDWTNQPSRDTGFLLGGRQDIFPIFEGGVAGRTGGYYFRTQSDNKHYFLDKPLDLPNEIGAYRPRVASQRFCASQKAPGEWILLYDGEPVYDREFGLMKFDGHFNRIA